MDELDKEIWNGLMQWGTGRVADYLNVLDQGSQSIFNEANGYNQTVLSLEVHTYFQQMNETEREILPPNGSLEALCRIFNLDAFEYFCIVMIMLGELDYNFEKLFVYLNNDWNQRLPSVEWLIRIYTMEEVVKPYYLKYFLPDDKLGRYLLDINSEGIGSGLRKGLKLKKAVLEYLLCSGRFLNRDYLRWKYSSEEHIEDWLEPEICNRITFCASSGAESGFSQVFHLQGEDSREALWYPLWYGNERKQPVEILDYSRMQDNLEPEQFVTVLEEGYLTEGILCIHNWETAIKGEKEFGQWSAFFRAAVDRFPLLFIVSEEEQERAFIPSEAMYVSIVLRRSRLLNKKYWELAAGAVPVAEEVLEQISFRFSFSMTEMRKSIQEARQIAHERKEELITAELLNEACQKQLKHRLKEWAVRITPVYTWENLILPQEQKEILAEVINQMKYRKQVYEDWGFSRNIHYGTGLSVLLTGPPGTGKTMTAQVLAGALGMEVYKVQLPAVMSKYIGETEKNLKMIFQEGEKSRAVLFFDEADVLFSKRTEIKDSHDKYSNMEAAFLLQKMEEYTGVVILATNYLQNIDEAFQRRIKYTIEFYMPDREQRYFLWKQSFPKELPLDFDVDLEWLAEQFELSGSNIKNIAVNAAFLAAPEQSVVGMSHIMKALKNEYKKSGKNLTKEEMI